MDRSKLFAKILVELPEDQPGQLLHELEVVRAAMGLGLGEILENPAIDKDKKLNILKRIFKDYLSSQMIEFTSFLARENEISELNKIALNYQKLLSKQGKLVKVEAITATPLPEDKLTEIKKMVQEKLHRQPLIENQVDGTVLGGIAIKIGDRVYDNTVSKKIDNLYREMVGEK